MLFTNIFILEPSKCVWNLWYTIDILCITYVIHQEITSRKAAGEALPSFLKMEAYTFMIYFLGLSFL